MIGQQVFRNGTPMDYTGPRKADGIISYMIKYAFGVACSLHRPPI